MESYSVFILQPNPHGVISGGYVYNLRLSQELKQMAIACKVVNLGMDFPNPSDASIDECKLWFQHAQAGSVVIIDSLVLAGIHHILKIYNHKFRLIAMMHLPLVLNPDIKTTDKDVVNKHELEALQFMEKIVVTSGHTHDYLVEQGIHSANIHVIQPGIDPVNNNRKYPNRPKHLLCVSNIIPLKRQNDIVEALSTLKKYEWELTLCGDTSLCPDYFGKVYNTIVKHGLSERILFKGKVEHNQLMEYYAQADLLIHASEYETYGMVLSEAMAHKLPVVTSDAGGLRQTISSDVALFFESGNVQQLRKNLLTLLEDANAYQKLVNGYKKNTFQLKSWQMTVREFYEILKPQE